jgi:hypothetical protein
MALSIGCPVCHQPLPWIDVFRPAGSRWDCRSCGSRLGVNLPRRLVITALYLVVVLVTVPGLLLVSEFRGYGMAIAIPIILLAWIPFFLALDCPRVIERRGLRCRSCGYDLKGQVAPRCPECGHLLDDEERQRLANGDFRDQPARRRPRSRLWIAIPVTVGVLLVALNVVGVVLHMRLSRARAARAAATATQPVASQPAPAAPS